MTTASSEWPLWSTTAHLVVTSPGALEPAIAIADRMLGEIDATCSRFRSESELQRIHSRLPQGVIVSPLLASLVRHALNAAIITDGDVDPTLGYAMDAAGYDRDIRLVEDDDAIIRAIVSAKPGWRSMRLVGSTLQVPGNLALDLGATAKAFAADSVAAAIAEQLGCGVLLSLGGDIATAGPEPENGWNVLVQDLPDDPASTVRLTAGFGIATSSTQKRRWRRAGETAHHILDPRTGLPADPVWRTVTVAASSCLRANTLSTASIVRGERAVAWLTDCGVAARLVHRDGRIVTVGGWPVESPEHAPELAGVG